MTRLSVVVPSYNHARWLRACIDSVLSQDHPDTELIVVDDGSSDDSLAILRSYGDRLTLLQQRGGRQGRARNLALGVARGELVAFLDSDDRFLPGRLSSAVAAFEADAGAAVVWGDYRLVDASGRPLADARWTPPPGADAQPGFARLLIAGNPICNSTVTVRRRVLDEIGGFDERIPRACDGAAWYAIAARGHRFVHLPGVVVEYRLHGGNDGARFVPMARDRDRALGAGAQAYRARGVVAPHEYAWLRDALARQLAFGAAASVQRAIGGGLAGRWRAGLYDALASDAGLAALARVKRLADLLRGRR